MKIQSSYRQNGKYLTSGPAVYSVFLLLLMAIFLLVAPSEIVHAQNEPQDVVGEFKPTDCFYETGIPFLNAPESLGFECGYVIVPETHSQPTGATIRIPVAIRKTTSTSPLPDPLFLAQGGPGGDAFGVFLTAGDSSAAKDRDIVVFNQRGTLYAEPDLICEESWNNQLEILAADEEEATRLSKEANTQCHNRLTTTERIDLSAFDSLENAADVDIIRQALGYETYNFYGVSYGTLLGLHLIDRQPQALRSVILDGVVTKQTNFLLEIAQNENRAYDAIFDACTQDSACNEAYPNLEERLTQIYAHLDKAPASISVRDDESGESVVVQVDGGAMKDFIFQLFYVKDFYAVFPRFVADLEEENYLFFQNMFPLFAFDQTFSEGMYLTVICAEDSDFTVSEMNLTGVRPYIAESAPSDMQELLNTCETWQVDPLPNSVDDPTQSDIPTLLLSGHFDPVTPPSFADEASETLSKSYHFVDTTGAHGVAFDSGCIDSIAADFLNNPEKAPNDECLAQAELTEFVPTNAIQIPIFQELAGLKTGVSIQLGALILFSLILLSGLVIWPLALLINKLRRHDQDDVPQASWVGPTLSCVVGIITASFIGGFFFYLVQAFSSSGLITYGAIDGSARFIFILPLAILVLSIAALYSFFRSWIRISRLGKVYSAFLMISMAGISTLLFTLKMFAPLWG